MCVPKRPFFVEEVPLGKSFQEYHSAVKRPFFSYALAGPVFRKDPWLACRRQGYRLTLCEGASRYPKRSWVFQVSEPIHSGFTGEGLEKPYGRRWGYLMRSFVLRGGELGYHLLVRPLLTGYCRMDPSCMKYAVQACEIHGFIKGSWLTLRRLMRCHPWGRCFYDPVPESSLSMRKQS